MSSGFVVLPALTTAAVVHSMTLPMHAEGVQRALSDAVVHSAPWSCLQAMVQVEAAKVQEELAK